MGDDQEMSDSFQIDGETYQPSFNNDGKLIGCRDENDEYTECQDCRFEGRCPGMFLEDA